jgi:hypothetical protein
LSVMIFRHPRHISFFLGNLLFIVHFSNQWGVLFCFALFLSVKPSLALPCGSNISYIYVRQPLKLSHLFTKQFQYLE